MAIPQYGPTIQHSTMSENLSAIQTYSMDNQTRNQIRFTKIKYLNRLGHVDDPNFECAEIHEGVTLYLF